MSFPIAGTQYPTGSSAPATAQSGSFIPEVWSAKIIEKFYNATVLAAIANTDYEGEIRNHGDKVIIRQRPTITISTYEVGQALDVQRPSAAVVELLIDKGIYWNTMMDDVYEIQSDIDQMSMWADDAAEQAKTNIDAAVLAALLAGVSADNKGLTAGVVTGNVSLGVTGTPLAVSAGTVNPITLITRMGQVLDEQNRPENRWMVIPPWVAAEIKRSDLKDASLTGDGVSMLRNGRLGMIDRFTLYLSNQLPVSGSETTIFAGDKHALTFASQLSKVETLRSELAFGTMMRGLQVYGYKMVDGKGMCAAVIT